uniref:Uncharacterized protein n=1 Tax=Rhizophora mucronata TaxID=61149 RepID=A0A2P2JXS7_RHIMU
MIEFLSLIIIFFHKIPFANTLFEHKTKRKRSRLKETFSSYHTQLSVIHVPLVSACGSLHDRVCGTISQK